MVLFLLHNVCNIPRFYLIHLTTPKYKVAYGVNCAVIRSQSVTNLNVTKHGIDLVDSFH